MINRHYLASLFEPASVAVFGVSERPNSIATIVYQNILEAGFKGEVFAINPKYKQLHSRPCYTNINAISANIELAIIATPAKTVPEILEECGQHGVKAAIVLSAGFRESGSAGLKIEQSAVEIARRHGIRFIGPNCLGLIRPSSGLNATFAKGGTQPGKIALISQSGALCTAILDWAENQDIGFSAVVSLGISIDIDFGEILDFLVNDSQTQSILMYVEGIRNARAFMSGVRAAARVKPVIAIKAGRHQAGVKAAISHTGALVGADDVFDAALRRAGVVRGMHIGDLFAAATVLAHGARLQGEELTIITNGGGPAAMACDKASDLNIALTELSSTTVEKLNTFLPPMWSHSNPIDILGDASAERYEQVTKTVLEDEKVNGILVMLTPQAMTEPESVAHAITEICVKSKKPIITCWMGDKQVATSRALFSKNSIPTFRLPETAVQGYAYLTNFYRNQKLLLQTPGPLGEEKKPDLTGAQLIIENAISERRKVLTEPEAKAVLSAFHIPVVAAVNTRTASEAAITAQELGFPVCMKINSKLITHKSDIGGVRLNVASAAEAQLVFSELIENAKTQVLESEIEGVVIEPMITSNHARELLVGILRDEVFGPVITFGTGGTTVELMADRSVALPPLNRLLIRDLISQTRASKFLQAYRKVPAANQGAIENVLLRISEIACEIPGIVELDINPLLATSTGVVAVDARIVVDRYYSGSRRYSHTAIHPYPSHLVTESILPGGMTCTIRPIRPEDAEMEQIFVETLSEQSRHYRFMNAIKHLTPELLARFTQIDYDREMAFVATIQEAGVVKQIGVARYVIEVDGDNCEFAIVVADLWQGKGVAQKLMESLIDCARNRGLKMMRGDILADNQAMQNLARKFGFSVKSNPEDSNTMIISKQL